MSRNPLISVIIPTHNSASFVVQAVESAFAQTYSPIEVIVIDDGSTDSTKQRLSLWENHIRYVHQSNGGPSKARNRGIELSRGELIAFLDADDRWIPEKLSKQWECLRLQPSVPMVHTDIEHLYEATGERVHVESSKKRFSGRCYTEFFWTNQITTSSVLVTRRCLKEVGLFDERITSVEDRDLWLRIARHHPLGFVDERLVLYRLHPNNCTLNQRRMAENEYYVVTKALMADPAVWAVLGEQRTRRRIADFAFQAGYWNIERGDLRRARWYFRQAIGYSPLSLGMWAFWASTFLSPKLRESFRGLKKDVLA